jgi:hypothetical protein
MNYIIKLITIFILFFYLINLNYKYNYILPNNNKFNLFKNFYDIKEFIHLYTYSNDLKNKVKIPKYLKPRNNDIPIKNKYELIKNEIIYDDYFFVIYFINNHKCKIIVRRLDSFKINNNFSIKIYSIDNDSFDIINFYNIKSTYANEIIINFKTKIELFKVIYKKIKIPKIIIQTAESDITNQANYNAILSFIELNPEYTYIFMDKNDRSNFIKKHFNEKVFNAYNNILIGTYKADLFRYCYIYIKGGCYFDHKMVNRTPIRDIINENDNIILVKHLNSSCNNIIISIKNQEIFLDCINKCTFNINNKLYCNSPWDITGPNLLNKYSKKYNYKYKLVAYFEEFTFLKTSIKNVIKFNNIIFCNHSYFD